MEVSNLVDAIEVKQLIWIYLFLLTLFYHRYMGQMYNLDAFTVSCPADQDILSHYKMQQGAKMSRREELETPTFTNDVPAPAQ